MRLFFVAVVFACAGLSQALPHKLTDVLAKYDIAAPSGDLDQGITSYGVRNEAEAFSLFFYFHSGNQLPDAVNAWQYDKRKRVWIRKAFDVSDLKVHHPGSIISITPSSDFLLVKTHRSPSAGYTLVFTRELEYREALYGWPLAVFGTDTLVWHHSQVHFAPVHAAEISIYDPHSGSRRQIYPLEPFPPVRQAHMEKITAARKADPGQDLDYEWFTNHVWSDVVVNDDTRSLAFEIAFDNTEYLSERDLLRIEVFRDYRRRGGDNPSRALLMAIAYDLRRLRRMDREQQALELFDGEARTLAEALLGGDVDQVVAPEIWQLFAELAGGPQEFTRAVYVFRNLRTEEPPDYREVPFADVPRLCGSELMAGCLEPESLARIFR